jgi:hypothetical protein
MRAAPMLTDRPVFPTALSKNRPPGRRRPPTARTVGTGGSTGICRRRTRRVETGLCRKNWDNPRDPKIDAFRESRVPECLTDGQHFCYAGRMLLFKKQFLPAIRAGQKTQTIRLWKHRRMRAGQLSYIPGVGRIRLTTVEEVDLEQLGDADARPDGFESADQLRAEIARLYPQRATAGYRAFRVVFALEEAADK